MEQLRVDAAARLDELRERVNEVLDELDIDPDQFDLPEIPALPESELDGDQPEPLLDSRWKRGVLCAQQDHEPSLHSWRRLARGLRYPQ